MAGRSTLSGESASFGSSEDSETKTDIPPAELKSAVKHTGARSGAEAVLLAVKECNRRQKLAALADRLKGAVPGFMTLEDLQAMREDAKWEGTK